MNSAKQPSVSVVLVTWNSERYVQDALQSVMEQSYKNVSIMVVDNGSVDETVKIVRQQYPTVRVLQNFKNLGFAKAYNQGIKLSSADFVLIVNHDVILDPDTVKQLVKGAERHPAAGSWSPKLYTLFVQDIDPQSRGGNLKEFIKSDKLDAAGLEVFKSRQTQNRGEGAGDEPRYNTEREVFGFTGACAMFAKDKLEQSAVRGQYFDEIFFAYKEDMDLSWRMLLYGLSHWFIPSATAWHFRSFKRSAAGDIKSIVSHRRQASQLMKFYSIKNNILTLIKNDDPINVLVHLPWILGRQFLVIGYSIIYEPLLFWRSTRQLFKEIPTALASRKIIKSHQVLPAVKMRLWFK